jgi:hypothetical protein
MPAIARPLAYWPDVHLLVQSAVAGGDELNTRAFDPDEDRATRLGWFRDAGRHLAALHATVEVEGPRRTIQDDLNELGEYSDSVARLAPELADRFETMIATINTSAAALVEPAPVAGHGTFRTDQFMIENGRLVLIDLDSFCWANRARDIGNFLAYLKWKAIRRPPQAAFIKSAGRALLDGYVKAGPRPDRHWLALYQATSMLKIVGRRYRGLNYKEWALTPRLLDAADVLVRERTGW